MTVERDGAEIRVLVAEDEEHLGAILEHFLRGRGYSVTMCRDGRAALHALRSAPFDVALVDIVMPEMDGLEVLRHLQRDAAPPEVIIITGNGTIDTAITAIKLGAYDYISKPYRMAEIDVMVRRAWEKRELGRANVMLRNRCPLPAASIVAESSAMAAVMRNVAALASSPEPVVIVGERGTGKSRLARRMHGLSGRPADALIELAHEAGAWYSTPAIVGQEGGAVDGGRGTPAGAFISASRGTLVIDGDALAPDARTALVEAVRDGTFVRSGGTTRIPLGARVIVCAEPGAELRDFVSALSATRIELPPLRERQEDIEALAASILGNMDGQQRTLGGDASEALKQYTWPGNVTELRLVLARAALLAAGEQLSAAELRGLLAVGAVGSQGKGAPLADLEKQHIEAMLVRCNWHQGRAAIALGISTKTLYRKMREYGFRRPRKRKLARARLEA